MWSEGQAATNDGSAVDRPASDDEVGRAAQVACPPLAMAKRQIVHLSKDKQVITIVVIGPEGNSAVDVVVASIIVRGMLEGVATLKRQTAREALLDGGLQGVVMIIGIVPEIIDALGPTVLAVEGPAVVLRYSSGEANDSWIIDVIGWTTARKGVRALVSYVGERGGYAGSNLPLHADVPLIHSGQPVVEGARAREDVVGYKRAAIDAEALCFIGSKHTTDDTARVGDRIAVARRQSAPELGCRIKCRRTLSEIENESARVGVQLLGAEYRQVLRDRVPEDRAEHADVKAAAIPQADHGLGIRLIR